MTGKEGGHIDHAAAGTAPHVDVVNPDALEVSPGTEHERLEGWIPALATEEELRGALEKAFDYRGDVTITRKDGSKIEGYLFDRRTGATLKDSVVRLFPKGSDQKISVSYSEIAALAFTGRDTAAGKSWEAWMKKYAEKKAAGRERLEPSPRSAGLTKPTCPQIHLQVSFAESFLKPSPSVLMSAENSRCKGLPAHRAPSWRRPEPRVILSTAPCT